MSNFASRFAPALLVAGLFCAGPAVAQTVAPPGAPAGTDAGSETMPPPPLRESGPRRGGPEHRAEMLQHMLNLTPEQTTQVKALLASERSQMATLHANAALAPADQHSQMRSIHEGTDSKIRALLTPEQAAEYDDLQAHRRDRRRGGEEGLPPPTPHGPGGL